MCFGNYTIDMEFKSDMIKGIALVFFIAIAVSSSEKGCNTAANNCGECMSMSTENTCRWCADKGYTEGPRCDMADNLFNCSDIHVKLVSSVAIVKGKRLSRRRRVSPQKVAVTLVKDSPAIVPFEVKIPKDILQEDTLSFFTRTNSKYKIDILFASNWKNETEISATQFTIAKHNDQVLIQNLVPGFKVKFEVHLETDKCKQARYGLRVQIQSNKKSTLRIAVTNPGCPCQCQRDYGYCFNDGVYNCGICSCDGGYMGKRCEEFDPLVKLTRYDCWEYLLGSYPECSDHGYCNDNRYCTCNPGYSGRYCNCDNERCPRVNNQTCSGHGTCNCANCLCDPGYTGTACNCSVSIEQCLSANGLICGGYGTCECGQCVCETTPLIYTGPTCTERQSGKQCRKCSDCSLQAM